MAVSLFKSECTRQLSRIRPSSTFLTVTNYTNNFDELSNFSVCFHVSYLNSIRKALTVVQDYKPSVNDCDGFDRSDLEVAKMELIESYKMTLSGYNPLATSAHAYNEVIGDEIVGPEGPIKGLKLHRNQDILHLWGYRVHKRVLRRGNYPIDNRMPLTKAKDFLRGFTPLGNFVQFKLTPGKFERFVVEGITINVKQALRESGL